MNKEPMSIGIIILHIFLAFAVILMFSYTYSFKQDLDINMTKEKIEANPICNIENWTCELIGKKDVWTNNYQIIWYNNVNQEKIVISPDVTKIKITYWKGTQSQERLFRSDDTTNMAIYLAAIMNVSEAEIERHGGFI